MLDRKFNISHKNFILFIYVIVLTISGPFVLWFTARQEAVPETTTAQKKEDTSTKKEPSLLSFLSNNLLSDDKSPQIGLRISSGEKILITADSNFDKQAGVNAFAAQKYDRAISLFKLALKQNRNDPETLIYLNNAIASRQSDTVTLATSIPIGGSLNVAKEILRGVAQAQQEINQNGGINNRLVKIKIANDDNDPEIARDIATKFVADKEVLAVIGHNASKVSIAAAPIYQKGKLVEISPTSVARELTRTGDYILRTTPTTRGLASTLAQYTIDVARKDKVAICNDSQSPASQSFKEEFTEAIFEYGGEITAIQCDFSGNKFNPNAIPSIAVSNGAEALLLIPAVNNIDLGIAIAQANKQRLTLLGNHTMYTFDTLKQGQVDVNNMVLAVAWHPNLVSKTEFLEHAKKLWGGIGTWRTASAYDAAHVAFMGLKSGISRDKLQQALTNPEFSFAGATGKVRFLPSGDRQGKTALVKIQPGTKSQTGFDFSYLE